MIFDGLSRGTSILLFIGSGVLRISIYIDLSPRLAIADNYLQRRSRGRKVRRRINRDQPLRERKVLAISCE